MNTTMRKSIFSLIAFAVLTASQLQAQDNTFPGTGKVGIGTTSPSDKLHISDGNLRIQSTTGYQRGVRITTQGEISQTSSISDWLHLQPYHHGRVAIGHNSNANLYVKNNVGIGISTPSTNLEISDKVIPEIQFRKIGSHGIYQPLGRINFFEGHFDDAVSSRIEGTRGPGNMGQGELSFSTLETSGGSLEERMRITYQGNVGIGTTSPSHKLSVVGTINSEEIIVEESVGADFVFEDSYDLPTLQDIEAFIGKNQHLPGIAPASQMIEEGVKVGELQMQLLQKIEELTLYTIEQQKLIELQSEKMETQKNENESLLLFIKDLNQRIKQLEEK